VKPTTLVNLVNTITKNRVIQKARYMLSRLH